MSLQRFIRSSDKKTVSTRLMLCALLLVFSSGCQSKESPSADDSGGSMDKDKVYKISAAPYELVPVESNAPMTKYWEEKFNVDLDIWNVDPNKYAEILGIRIASGEVPDVFRITNYEDLLKYVNQDILAKIPEEMIKENAPNLYKVYMDYDPNHKFNYGKIDGSIYAINNLNYNGNYRYPIVYRGDWMKKVGVTKTPETLDEFEKLMYKFANEDPDGNGKKDTYGLSADGLMPVFGAFGYIPYKVEQTKTSNENYWQVRDGKLVNGAVQPEMKEALQLIRKWYKDGILDPEFITGENTGGKAVLTQAFDSGRIGFTTHAAFVQWNPAFPGLSKPGSNVQELAKKSPEAAEALAFGLPPKGPNGKSGIHQDATVDNVFLAFGKQLEKQPDKLAKILQMIDTISFSSYDNYNDAMFGVGNWSVVDGLATPNKEFVEPKDAAKIGAHLISNWLPNPLWKDKDFQPYKQWLKDTHMAEGGIANQLRVGLPSAVKYLTELDKIRDESYISIITGDKPIEFFDEFVGKWRKAGGDKLEQEANEWYASLQK